MKSISNIGEFGLIERIKLSQKQRGRAVLLGIGDDAAAFRLSPGDVGLATTDILVEKTHFDLSYTPYYDLGWRAMAANLSDIAAMGGKPLLALVSLTLTRRQHIGDIDNLYRGMMALARRFGVSIAGGDTVRGRELSVALTIIGQCRRRNIGLRSGARPGDAVLVTGALGGSAAGLDLLRSKTGNRASALVKRHLRPEPRVREGMALARMFKLGGMIDVSDGLASELGHLAQESRVSIVVELGALPVSPVARTVAGRLGGDPIDYCLNGGEDYELLFTLPRAEAKRAIALLEREGTRCTIIGRCVRGRGVGINCRDGRIRPLAPTGWRHF